MSGWTQPLCDYCWEDREGARVPSRLREPEEETCSNCGRLTRSGIYVRRDPATVKFPSSKDAE